MKITNLELLQSIPGLNMISGLHLPVKTSYGLGKLMRAAASAETDYNNARVKLIEKHGKRDGEGKLVEQKNAQGAVIGTELEDKDAFEAEVKELTSIEVDLPGEQINLDSLGNVNLPASALAHLHWLIKE